MALTLDATVGGASSNSFITRAVADSYFEGRPTSYATAWTGASDTDKDASLVWATQLLDAQMAWHGQRYDTDPDRQRLRWPRFGTYDRDGVLIDSDIIPRALQEATAEFARYLLDSDRTAESGVEGLRSLKVGPISLDFDKMDRTEPMPDAVYRLVSHLGALTAGLSSTSGTVSLVRT